MRLLPLLLTVLLLMVVPLTGCGNTSEKRAELQRAQDVLHTLTLETEQMRAKVPSIVRMEEENKTLQHDVDHLQAEVEKMRRQLAEVRARKTATRDAVRRTAQAAAPRANP